MRRTLALAAAILATLTASAQARPPVCRRHCSSVTDLVAGTQHWRSRWDFADNIVTHVAIRTGRRELAWDFCGHLCLTYYMPGLVITVRTKDSRQPGPMMFSATSAIDRKIRVTFDVSRLYRANTEP